MKLLIKQRVFSWSDSYDVYDEYGNGKRYYMAKDFGFSDSVTSDVRKKKYYK